MRKAAHSFPQLELLHLDSLASSSLRQRATGNLD
jgi:hypothetical protein